MATIHNNCLMESECFEIWLVATESCRKEIIRLERLIAFRDGETNEAALKVLAP